MTGERTSMVFGETLWRHLCLPVSLQKRNTLEAISYLRRAGYPFV